MESILRPVFNDVEALLMSVVPFFYVVALILGILSIRIKKRIKALGVIILVVDVIGSLFWVFMLAYMASGSSAW